MTSRHALLLTCGLAALATGGVADAAEPTTEGTEFFEKRIRPLLAQHCYSCHSAQAKKLRGNLRLDTREGTMKVVVPGSPAKSPLIHSVKRTDDAPEMPPEKPLAAADIADLEAWVKMGAPDPRSAPKAQRLDPEKAREFWSLRPLTKTFDIRSSKSETSNPIDAFLSAAREAKGLRPAPPADKRALIRRATFDLTGLPPTPEEIDGFLRDDSSEAFARVLDRLLASPAYGERWGRHWLDVVRYADTAGDNSDYPIPQMVGYRDWVIDAVNRDLPYDEFVRRQLAGDLLPSDGEADRRSKLIATGYLANAKRFGSYEDKRYPWHLTIEDTIDNLGRTFLGLTINCARCHDHKFDPVSQEDYYALYGFFQSTRYPWPGIELDKVQRDLVPLGPAEAVAKFEKERRDKLAEFDARIKEVEADKDPARAEERKKKVKALRDEREAFGKKPAPFETAYAVAEGTRRVGNARMQIKGDPEHAGPEVPRRFPTVLGGQTLPPDAKGSGRLQLAGWITDPSNPLTARVMVNRIWQGHFGKGIVQTPSNFGTLGTPPTHPELLDFLAVRFIESGWSVKAMHRLMMLSDAYRMSSADAAANAKIDIGNDLLWRFNRRRLDAESIRDSLLSVSGGLDRRPGKPHPFPAMSAWNFTQHNPFKAVYDADARSVYLMTQRIQRHPFLALFDGADTNASTDRRLTSTTPLQALYLMNDPFVHAQAGRFASRLLAERGDDAGRVDRAFVLLFGRGVNAEERSAALGYLSQAREKLRPRVPADRLDAEAWESLARALFQSNEFVYVD